MKRLFALFLVFASSFAFAIVQNTPHDLSVGSTATFHQAGFPDTNVTAICVFCHTPHQPNGVTTDPLWNHTLSSTASYGVYSSTTLNATPTDIGGQQTVSNLCMSCHDGTVGVGSQYNQQNGVPAPSTAATTISNTNPAYLGTDLTNDHPINFTYDAALATADGELNTPVSASCVDASCNVPLFGGTLQCASCHDPHDNTLSPFLTVTQVDSALCTTCHQK
jgi:predicted CXXCH cytochrome family protein